MIIYFKSTHSSQPKMDSLQNCRHFLILVSTIEQLMEHQLPLQNYKIRYAVYSNLYPPAKTETLLNFCHQNRARPACTSVLSDQALYCCLTNFKILS